MIYTYDAENIRIATTENEKTTEYVTDTRPAMHIKKSISCSVHKRGYTARDRFFYLYVIKSRKNHSGMEVFGENQTVSSAMFDGL